MTNKTENIDSLFRDGLYDYSETPDAAVWQKIQSDLPQKNNRVLSLTWIRIAASVILLAGISALGWKYLVKDKTVANDHFVEVATSDDNQDLSGISTQIQTEAKPAVIAESTSAQREKTIREVQEPLAETDIDNIKIAAANTDMKEVAKEILLPSEAENDDEFIATDSKPILPVDEQKEITPGFTVQPEIISNEEIIRNNLLALEEEKEERQRSVWSVGGQAGPQYTYREVFVNSAAYPVEDYDKYESGVLAYAGGINVELEPTGRFSFRSGLFYSKIGQVKSSLQLNDQFSAIGESYLYGANDPSRSSHIPSDLVNSTGNISFDKDYRTYYDPTIEWEEGLVTAEQYFEFIEIPFIVKYKIVDKKLDIDLSSGLWANFLIGNKAIATDNQYFNAEGVTQNINSVSYSGSLSVGFGYPISQNLDLNFEPFFKYYLTPINTNPETSVHPYSMGILSGVRYSF